MQVIESRTVSVAEGEDYGAPSTIPSGISLTSLYDVFREPGAGPEGNTLRRVCYENIASRNHGDASAIGELVINDAITDLVSGLGTRQYLISEGHCVINERFRSQTEAYARYIEKQGLLPPNSIENVVWVKDPTDTLAVLQTLADKAAEAVPYVQRAKFFELAQEAGAQVHGSGADVASSTVEHFYDKVLYRNWIQETFGRDAIPFPRFSLTSDNEPSRLHLDAVLEYAMAYQPDLSTGSKALLFMQLGKSGGGIGNARIFANADGSFDIINSYEQSAHFADLDGLYTYLCEARKSANIDVTPYVPLRKSYTLGIMVADSGVTVVGPLDQILVPGANDYQGWRVDASAKEEDYADLPRQMRIALRYGEQLRASGYRGWADEDIFEFTGPDGEVYASRSESNVRRDAMTHLIGFILSNEQLRSPFLEGRLSVMQDDHFNVSDHLNGIASHSDELAAVIEREGVPLASKQNPYGALLMAAPLPHQGGAYYGTCLALIAPSDQQRDAWFQLLQERISRVTVSHR